MVKIIVAFANQEKCARYAGVLEEAGLPVFRHCASFSEVRRALDECGDGVVVCACRMPDGTPDALAWDIGERAAILAAGTPEQLQMCENPGIFRLSVPCSKGEVASAVSMLVQLRQMRLPHRGGNENQLISQAKEYLMRQHSLTEPEAHHYLQKGAMNRGMKLAVFAAQLLKNA